MTELSVVLITKNQAWNISRLIGSVLEGTSCVASNEIVLVDSASTDGTVALASCHPMSIFRLPEGQPLSPAIGRYIGYKQTRGQYVLFLDGDTQLVAGWLARAVRVMHQNPQVGAATGRVINLPTSSAAGPPMLVPHEELTDASREVLWGSYGGGGAAMYRRSVLEQVGSFNPYLCSDEEPDLGLRIRRAGYRIVELDHPIVCHYNDAPLAVSNVLSRRRRRFLLGIGQGARYYFRTRLFWPWLQERWWGPLATLWTIATLTTFLFGLMARDSTWLKVWSLAMVMTIVGVALRKGNLSRGLVTIFNWLLMAEGFVRGFLMTPFPPEKFRANIEVIQNGANALQEFRAVAPPPSAGTRPNRTHLPAGAPSR